MKKKTEHEMDAQDQGPHIGVGMQGHYQVRYLGCTIQACVYNA